jgi:hypothetical protein
MRRTGGTLIFDFFFAAGDATGGRTVAVIIASARK